MDPKRFDRWTKDRALRLSRRNALKLAGAGAATAALGSAASTFAQSPCAFRLNAQLAGGPTTPATYDGVLQYTVGADGMVSQGTFTPAGGPPATVAGSVIGHAVDLSIALAGSQTLVLSGAADRAGQQCPSALAGVLTGPQPGDIGAWQATQSSATAPGSSGSSSQSSSSSSSSSSSGTSSLSCPPPQIQCGPNCCPGGATCTNAAQGLCACPDETEQCGTMCVQSCPDGQFLDLDACMCQEQEAACIQNQQSCQNHGQCCSGYCGGGTCFDCAGKVCGDFGCIDPSRDSQNCGNCGNVCVYPQVCTGGVCGCAPDSTPCIDHAECCSQLCFVTTCTSCSDVTTGDGSPLTFCGAGECVNLNTDIDHCGACGNVCPRTSGGIVCEAGICHDINNDADFCGFSQVTCPAGQICRFGDCVNP